MVSTLIGRWYLSMCFYVVFVCLFACHKPEWNVRFDSWTLLANPEMDTVALHPGHSGTSSVNVTNYVNQFLYYVRMWWSLCGPAPYCRCNLIWIKGLCYYELAQSVSEVSNQKTASIVWITYNLKNLKDVDLGSYPFRGYLCTDTPEQKFLHFV